MAIKKVCTLYEIKNYKQVQKRKMRGELLRMGFTFFMGAIKGRWSSQAKPKITEEKDTFIIELYDNANYYDWSKLLKKSKYKWIVKLWDDYQFEKFPNCENGEVE